MDLLFTCVSLLMPLSSSHIIAICSYEETANLKYSIGGSSATWLPDLTTLVHVGLKDTVCALRSTVLLSRKTLHTKLLIQKSLQGMADRELSNTPPSLIQAL